MFSGEKSLAKPAGSLLADAPGGFLGKRREVDPDLPIGHVAAHADLSHAAVGEDGFEEGESGRFEGAPVPP